MPPWATSVALTLRRQENSEIGRPPDPFWSKPRLRMITGIQHGRGDGLSSSSPLLRKSFRRTAPRRDPCLRNSQQRSASETDHHGGMVMDRKPFEITAVCEIAAFSTSADIERFSTQLERRRQSRPNIVRATVNPPATYREQRYVLQTRFVVWAKDAAQAIQTVEGLLHDVGVRSRTVLPSGRALAATEVPPPSPLEEPRRAATSPRPPAGGRKPQRRARKPRGSSKLLRRTQRSEQRPKR